MKEQHKQRIESNQNPFDLETVPDNFMNIMTGQVASNEEQQILATCLDSGQTSSDEFVKKRFIQERTIPFWHPHNRAKTLNQVE